MEITTLRNTTWTKKILFFFSLTTLFLTVYLSQFSLTLSIFLFSFCLHSLTQFSKTALNPHTLVLHYSSTPNGRMAFPFYFFTLFFFSSFNVSRKFNITLSFTWLDVVHLFINVAGLLYIIIEKKMKSIFSFGQATLANPFHFAGSSALVQQTHLMS